MDVQLLTQADRVLSKCGRYEAPREDLSAVYLPKSFMIQQTFAAGATTPVQTITKEITGDTDWCLRAMQIWTSAATLIEFQIQKPDGRFLINALQDVLQVAGYGSYRYLWTVEHRCPPGSKLKATFAVTNTALQQPIAISFDGAYQYLITKGIEGRICRNEELAAKLPRYFSDPNQNIMAPRWQQGLSHWTPPGYVDTEKVWSPTSPLNAVTGLPSLPISVTAAINTATQSIQIPTNEEAHVRRLLFAIQADAGVTSGTFLAKIRDGSGYSLFDDYFDVNYICSAAMPHNWIVKPEDTVYADIQLVDQGGVGNMYFCMMLEGFRRRRG
jgi:hypothetical protein